MDIRQITYFIAIADAKNYSTAAKSLFVTQPTLSQAIKKLELELNTSLLTKNGRYLELTKTGKILYEQGKKLVTHFNQMVEDIQLENQSNKKETLRIGLTSLFAIQFMKQISEFVATHPNVELVLRQDGSRYLQELLANEEVDIGLLSFPKIKNEITIEPLQTSTQGYQVSVVVPSSNPLSKKKTIEFKDLEGQKFSSLSEHFMLGELLPRRCRSLGFDPHIVFTHEDWEVLIHSLIDLDSVMLLPTEFKSMSHIPHLQWIPLQDKSNFFPIGIATRKHYVCSPAANDFMMILKKN